MKKPELLLPVGNTEAFYGAVRGGADAIYVGLKNFNARGRAANFNNHHFQLLLNEAHKNNIRVYVTLNTVIKNRELGELIDVLWFLSHINVDAVIIQDWGTYHIMKKFFPKLIVHASTQMGNHNSLGTHYSKKLGFERVILARELTLPELTQIQKNTPIETEVFVHGALCYSFSGMCNFSSYLGGSGANRGLCTQPCRRFYKVENSTKLAFSLKDNQLVDIVPQLAKIGISSLKVEGRLKTGEYVNLVAKAYRKVLDKKDSIENATSLLQLDMGREKTKWFAGHDVKHAVSETPNTGLFLGKVSGITGDGFSFSCNRELQKGNRLRIKTSANSEQTSIKLEDFTQDGDIVVVNTNIKGLKKGNEVYLAGLRQEKFPNKLKGDVKPYNGKIPFNKKKEIINSLRKFKPQKHQTIYIRIDSVDWLRKIRFDDFDHLILNLKKNEWQDFRSDSPFIQKNRHKIWIEFPQFIQENDIDFYKKLALNFYKKGFRQFSLSHLSQKELLPKGASFGTNENVYCYNDAAVMMMKNEGAKWFTSPYENEYDNLLSGASRDIIVPIHYYPKLFYSRQPVEIRNNETFYDDNNKEFRKLVINGITTVVPAVPVSLLQYKNKLAGKGFTNYMIDLSFEKPSKHTIKRLLTKLKRSEQDQPSTTFNFKKGLK